MKKNESGVGRGAGAERERERERESGARSSFVIACRCTTLNDHRRGGVGKQYERRCW